MKLLFDQNISYRVIKEITHLYPNAQQVRMIGLENTSDIRIWEYAKKHNYSIVSFDADYYDIANLKGHPPKIIWLRIGNTRTEQIAQLFIDKYELIKDFIIDPANQKLACLEIE